MRPEAGVVHVGEGLLGEKVQNFFHRLVGKDEENLTYVDDDLYASVRLDARRPFWIGRTLSAGPWIEAYDAFGFRRHLIAGGAFEWWASRKLTVVGYLAARNSRSDLALLDRWFVGWGGAAKVGLSYGRLLTVSLSHNAMGTEDQHLHIRLRLPLRKGPVGPPKES